MKAAILVCLVLLVVTHGEALRCHCSGIRRCPRPIENCRGPNNVCASVIIYAGSSTMFFRGCLTANQCRNMNRPGLISASCCGRDLCNR